MAKKDRFDYFDAFVRQADVARRQSQALLGMLEDYRGADPEWLRERLGQMHAVEKEGDLISHEIHDRLAVEFIPPIDTEDVAELSMRLDDVIDAIEEVAQHLYMYDIREVDRHAVEVARIVDESVEALVSATRAFREFKKPKKLGRLLVAIHDKESEGDEMYIDAVRDLFSAPDVPCAHLVAWNSMFSHMEKCCDACEKAAVVMQTIALKNA